MINKGSTAQVGEAAGLRPGGEVQDEAEKEEVMERGGFIFHEDKMALSSFRCLPSKPGNHS